LALAPRFPGKQSFCGGKAWRFHRAVDMVAWRRFLLRRTLITFDIYLSLSLRGCSHISPFALVLCSSWSGLSLLLSLHLFYQDENIKPTLSRDNHHGRRCSAGRLWPMYVLKGDIIFSKANDNKLRRWGGLDWPHELCVWLLLL
jgi:hypothetical protein